MGGGRNLLTRVLNVTSENGSDAIAAVKRLFQLINYFVGYEQMRRRSTFGAPTTRFSSVFSWS
jgi:hypothetical protein